MKLDVYSSIKSENSFGKVHAVLKQSNIESFIQKTSDTELLQKKISETITESIKTKEEFYDLISYLFQSLTNIGYTTYEILEFICNAINAGTKDDPVFDDEQKKRNY